MRRHDTALMRKPPDEGTDGGGDTAETRPRADGTGAVVGPERGLEDGERAGREQGTSQTLQGPTRDQDAGNGSERADQ